MNCNPLPSSAAVIIYKAGYLHRWLGRHRKNRSGLARALIQISDRPLGTTSIFLGLF
jgi:hypothetical protein